MESTTNDINNTNEISEIAKNDGQRMGPMVAENSGDTSTNTPPVKPSETNCEGDESGETNCADVPEMPSGEQGTMGAPGMSGMPSGGFPGEATTTVSDTNEWLIPMTCTGIVSGVVVVAAVVVCLLTYKFTRGAKKGDSELREKKERDGAHYNG